MPFRHSFIVTTAVMHVLLEGYSSSEVGCEDVLRILAIFQGGAPLVLRGCSRRLGA